MIRRSIVLALGLVLVLATAPTVLAKAGGTDRPIQGGMTGEIIFLFDWEHPTCPVKTVSDTYGTISHLGKVWAHWSHCPPIVLPGYTDGHMVLTAANGDTIIGEYEDADGDSPFVIDLVGGTGRFAGAHGQVSVDFIATGEWGPDELPIQPWHWEGWLEGMISY